MNIKNLIHGLFGGLRQKPQPSTEWHQVVSPKQERVTENFRPLKRQAKWDIRFLNLAKEISTWSKDPSTKVGAVITNGINIVSIGFNGLPQQMKDYDGILNDRTEKYKHIIHAEMNAILRAQYPLNNCTLYTYPFLPCTNCASMVIQSGINRVVSYECRKPQWKTRIEESKRFFSMANVKIFEY